MSNGITKDGNQVIIDGKSLFVRNMTVEDLVDELSSYVFEQANSIQELIFPNLDFVFQGWVSPMSKDDPEYDLIRPEIHEYVRILSEVPTMVEKYIPLKGLNRTEEEYEVVLRRQVPSFSEEQIQLLNDFRKVIPNTVESYLAFSEVIDEETAELD